MSRSKRLPILCPDIMYSAEASNGGEPMTNHQGPNTRDQAPKTKDQGPTTRDHGPGTKDQATGTRQQAPRTKHQGTGSRRKQPRIKDRGTQNQATRTRDQGPRTKDQGPRTPNQEVETRTRGKESNRDQDLKKYYCFCFFSIMQPLLLILCSMLIEHGQKIALRSLQQRPRKLQDA